MKIVRSYKKGQTVSYDLPYADREWTVQIANNVTDVAFVGEASNGSTSGMITGAQNFGNTLSCLDTGCFRNCRNVERVYLSPQIKRIGNECFSGCAGMDAVAYESYETWTETAQTPALAQIGARVLAGCQNVKAITLPETVADISQIDPQAFAGSSLTSITLLGITSTQLLGS